jgi:hypothetical protein
MTRRLELILTGLSLATDRNNRPASGFWFETNGDDIDFGAPGEDGTRTIQATVVVCGYSSDDLNDGERVLAQVAHTDNAGRLEWLPPDSGPRSLYWVKSSRMAVQFDDLALTRGVKERTCRVVLTCDRYAYPETVTTETFSPGTPTITVIDACTANTNWAGTTAVTHLTQSAVRKGPVTATASSPTHGDDWFVPPHLINYGVATSITYSNGSSPSSGNYMYLDFAYAFSGFGTAIPPQLVSGGTRRSPIASQLQADGYMRYFYTRVPGPLTFVLEAYGMASGDTASFYVDEFGTADILPSGSVLVLNTKAAVTCGANLRISDTAGSGLGETIVYSDPAMLTHGWDPASLASWPNAPEGDYWVYEARSGYVVGDVLTLTIGGITATNRMDASAAGETRWIPFGPFELGGNKSRRLGSVSGLVSGQRLFRKHPDATMVAHAYLGTAAAGNSLFIEPESIDFEHPGVFVGSDTTGIDATTVAWPTLRAWSEAKLIAPTTALFVQCDNATSPVVVVSHRPPGHTSAAEY